MRVVINLPYRAHFFLKQMALGLATISFKPYLRGIYEQVMLTQI